MQPWTVASAAGLSCAADVLSGKRKFDNCEGQKLGPAACCGAPPIIYAYSKTRMFMSENTADAYQVRWQLASCRRCERLPWSAHCHCGLPAVALACTDTPAPSRAAERSP